MAVRKTVKRRGTKKSTHTKKGSVHRKKRASKTATKHRRKYRRGRTVKKKSRGGMFKKNKDPLNDLQDNYVNDKRQTMVVSNTNEFSEKFYKLEKDKIITLLDNISKFYENNKENTKRNKEEIEKNKEEIEKNIKEINDTKIKNFKHRDTLKDIDNIVLKYEKYKTTNDINHNLDHYSDGNNDMKF